MKPVRGVKNTSRKKTTATVPQPAAPAVKTAPQPAVQAVKAALQSVAKEAKSTPQVALQEPQTTATGGNGSKTVSIEAKVDVGFGNTLFLRGEGLGLSWNQGIPLTCVDGSTWKWSGEGSDKLKFKLLLNDSVWAKGEDLVAEPGECVRVSPTF